jgi:hypothetical protein
MPVVKTMNHSQYQKDLRTKDSSALRFIIKDAQAAIKAMPDGPNAGYYTDEVHYCAMELKNRTDGSAREFQREDQEKNWIGAIGNG